MKVYVSLLIVRPVTNCISHVLLSCCCPAGVPLLGFDQRCLAFWGMAWPTEFLTGQPIARDILK